MCFAKISLVSPSLSSFNKIIVPNVHFSNKFIDTVFTHISLHQRITQFWKRIYCARIWSARSTTLLLNSHVSHMCSAATGFSYPYNNLCNNSIGSPRAQLRGRNLHCHKLQTGTSRVFQAVTANRVLQHNGSKCS